MMSKSKFWSESEEDLDKPAEPPVRGRQQKFLITRIKDGKVRRVTASSLQDAAKQVNRSPHRVRIQYDNES